MEGRGEERERAVTFEHWISRERETRLVGLGKVTHVQFILSLKSRLLRMRSFQYRGAGAAACKSLARIG